MLKESERRPLNVLTTRGWLTYTRYSLRPADEESRKALNDLGKTSVYPMDEYLGLDNLPFKVTCDMALALAQECIDAASYEAVATKIEGTYGKKTFGVGKKGLSADTLRSITNYIGEIMLNNEDNFVDVVVRNYDPKAIKIGHRRGRPKSEPFIVYVQTDGATYPAREEGDIAAGNRENKLGVIFTSDTMEEKTDGKGHVRPSIGEREYVCDVYGVEKHRMHLVAAALKYGLEEADVMIILSDGADWIRMMKEEYFPFAQQILDLYHLKENVCKFSDQEFGADNQAGKAWAKKVNTMLENGKWKDVLALPEVYQYSEEGGKEVGKGKFNLYNYIWKFRDCIDYPTYLEKGYLIGSGAVESGHRTVLQSRLKQPGMKWLPSKASGVLILRAKFRSGLWAKEVIPIVRKHYSKWHITKGE